MLRAGGPIVLVMALLCAPASAWGETPVESSFALPEGLRVEGHTTWRAERATLDLVPGLLSGETATLTIEGAQGWRIDSFERGNVELRDRDTQNETMQLGTGRLVIERCWSPCVAIVVVAGDALATYEGRAAGWLTWNPEPRTYWALTNQPEEGPEADWSYHALPAGTFGVGGGPPLDAMRAFEPRASVEGSFEIRLHNVSARWEGAGGPRVDTRPSREPIDPLGIVEEWRQSLVRLNALGALDLPVGTRAAFYAEAPEVDLAGRLVAPVAAGELRHGRNHTTLEGKRFDATGTFTLSPTVRDESLVGGLPVRDLSLRADVEGDAAILYAGEVRVHDAAQQRVAVGVPILAVLVSILVLFLRPALLLPLYSRLAREKILESATRQAILAHLAVKPGLTAEAIARELGLVRTTVAHHVVILQSHAFIVGHRSGRVTRLYPAELAPRPDEAAVRALLADESRRAIARQILAARQATPRDVARATALSRRLVAYHLAKLRQAGLVEARGWPHRFSATPRLEGLLSES